MTISSANELRIQIAAAIKKFSHGAKWQDLTRELLAFDIAGSESDLQCSDAWSELLEGYDTQDVISDLVYRLTSDFELSENVAREF